MARTRSRHRARGCGGGHGRAEEGDCRSTIAGTYYKAAGGLYNLSADGTITGSLSETSQVNAGQGDAFLGQWQCDGAHVTGHDFRWVDSSPRKISRTDWDATFSSDGGGTLTIHFDFARVDETSTAAQVLAAPVLFEDDITAIRIATP